MAHWRLTPELEAMRKEVEETARECGLDFFPTDFCIVDFETLVKVVANNGFPTRYNHWHFGMEYETLEREMGHGFSRIYELVINTNPAVAYLLQYNTASMQKMVMAHVYAHADFFKNNHHFRETDRGMIGTMKLHNRIVRDHIDKVGREKVEEFIEWCLSIDKLIDFTPYIKNPKDECEGEECSCRGRSNEDRHKCSCSEKKEELSDEYFPFPDYMRGAIKTENIFPELKKKKKEKEKRPERDVLNFIIESNDLLKSWEKDILAIIRDEAYYFLPQMKTKIMNEGWATFWHQYIMCEKGLAGIEGIVDYTAAQAAVVGGLKQPNPYMVGYEIFRDIRKRWDEGRHGKEYENETDALKKMKWNTRELKGLEKIFEVRETLSDVDFLREYFTDELIRELYLYSARYDKRSDVYRIASRDPGLIRQKLINMIFHAGQPVIEVLDGNFRNSKQLLLQHVFYGQELDEKWRNLTLDRLFRIWKRPVCLRTVADDAPVQISYNGEKIITERMQ